MSLHSTESKNTISEKTLQAALNVLDKQYNHCMNKLTATETQNAYYEGMKTMLNIVLSDYYTNGCFVGYSDFLSSHYVMDNIKDRR